MRKALAPIIALAICIGCSSRPTAEYWIPGLTLPPGSTVVTKEEMDKGSLFVGFDNPGSWKDVQAHFDQFLTGEGYVNHWRDSAAQSGRSITEAEVAKSLTQLYTKEGAEFGVMISDQITLNKEAESHTGQKIDLPPMGRYSVMINRMPK